MRGISKIVFVMWLGLGFPTLGEANYLGACLSACWQFTTSYIPSFACSPRTTMTAVEAKKIIQERINRANKKMLAAGRERPILELYYAGWRIRTSEMIVHGRWSELGNEIGDTAILYKKFDQTVAKIVQMSKAIDALGKPPEASEVTSLLATNREAIDYFLKEKPVFTAVDEAFQDRFKLLREGHPSTVQERDASQHDLYATYASYGDAAAWVRTNNKKPEMAGKPMRRLSTAELDALEQRLYTWDPSLEIVYWDRVVDAEIRYERAAWALALNIKSLSRNLLLAFVQNTPIMAQLQNRAEVTYWLRGESVASKITRYLGRVEFDLRARAIPITMAEEYYTQTVDEELRIQQAYQRIRDAINKFAGLSRMFLEMLYLSPEVDGFIGHVEAYAKAHDAAVYDAMIAAKQQVATIHPESKAVMNWLKPRYSPVDPTYRRTISGALWRAGLEIGAATAVATYYGGMISLNFSGYPSEQEMLGAQYTMAAFYDFITNAATQRNPEAMEAVRQFKLVDGLVEDAVTNLGGP